MKQSATHGRDVPAARESDDLALAKTSLERATSQGLAEAAVPLAEADARAALMRIVAKEASGESGPAERASQETRRPALWAAIGALAGADMWLVLSRVFGIGA